MKELSEDKLIEVAVEGDELAWNEIYRRYYSRVKRIVTWRKWGFRYAESEEIVQDVFMELLKALPGFRKESSLSTFLTRLTKNKCISVLRRKGAQKRAKEEYGFTFDEKKTDSPDERRVIATSSMGNPQESLTFLENSQYLSKAMEELSDDCRQVIEKRFFHDLSYREICEDLELPLGTVCSRLKRCILRLKEIFEKIFPEKELK